MVSSNLYGLSNNNAYVAPYWQYRASLLPSTGVKDDYSFKLLNARPLNRSTPNIPATPITATNFFHLTQKQIEDQIMKDFNDLLAQINNVDLRMRSQMNYIWKNLSNTENQTWTSEKPLEALFDMIKSLIGVVPIIASRSITPIKLQISDFAESHIIMIDRYINDYLEEIRTSNDPTMILPIEINEAQNLIQYFKDHGLTGLVQQYPLGTIDTVLDNIRHSLVNFQIKKAIESLNNGPNVLVSDAMAPPCDTNQLPVVSRLNLPHFRTNNALQIHPTTRSGNQDTSTSQNRSFTGESDGQSRSMVDRIEPVDQMTLCSPLDTKIATSNVPSVVPSTKMTSSNAPQSSNHLQFVSL